MLYNIVINDRSAGAKRLLEYLRTLEFAEVHREVPNRKTIAAIGEARTGRPKDFSSAEALLADLNK